MADADDSYDLENLGPFLEQLRDGDDLVMGNRFAGGIEPGAMPWLHRRIGNPVLSGIGRLFFRTPVRDFHCGIRGVPQGRDPRPRLALGRHGVRERDDREGEPRRSSRSARCPPRCAPTAARARRTCAASATAGATCASCCCSARAGCSSYPGSSLFAVGAVGTAALTFGHIGGLDIAGLLYAAALMIIGYQALWFGLLMQTYAESARHPARRRAAMRTASSALLTLERGLILGVALIVFGVLVALLSVLRWRSADFGALNPGTERARHHARDPRPGARFADDPRQLLDRRARHPHRRTRRSGAAARRSEHSARRGS